MLCTYVCAKCFLTYCLLSLTQIVTIETMLGEEKEQADCAQNGDCEEYFLPFDRLTLLCSERLAIIQYSV